MGEHSGVVSVLLSQDRATLALMLTTGGMTGRSLAQALGPLTLGSDDKLS